MIHVLALVLFNPLFGNVLDLLYQLYTLLLIILIHTQQTMVHGINNTGYYSYSNTPYSFLQQIKQSAIEIMAALLIHHIQYYSYPPYQTTSSCQVNLRHKNWKKGSILFQIIDTDQTCTLTANLQSNFETGFSHGRSQQNQVPHSTEALSDSISTM